jgi:2Fe-2S ferredoxin
MPHVHYVAADGTCTTLDVPVGNSVMLAAVFANLRGIAGECGGVLACATCHVYVDPAFAERLPPPSADERAMLETVAAERRSASRLSCQIEMTEALDGLVVRMPERQS